MMGICKEMPAEMIVGATCIQRGPRKRRRKKKKAHPDPHRDRQFFSESPTNGQAAPIERGAEGVDEKQYNKHDSGKGMLNSAQTLNERC